MTVTNSVWVTPLFEGCIGNPCNGIRYDGYFCYGRVYEKQ